MKRLLTFLTSLILVLFISCNSKKSSENAEVKPSLPEYELLDKVNLINGQTFADVLIESYSQDTPSDSIQEALIYIAQELDVDEIFLVCSKDAQKANYSASFAEKHPEATDCVIGSFKNGKFEK